MPFDEQNPSMLNAVREIVQTHQDAVRAKDWLIQFITGFLSMIAIQGEVFLRRGFGARYISILALLPTAIVFSLFTAFLLDWHEKPLAMLFLVYFLMLAFTHWLGACFRKRSIPVHSGYPGRSWIPAIQSFWLLRNPTMIYLAIEPGVVFLVGLLLLHIDHAFGWWCLVIAVAMFIKMMVMVCSNQSAGCEMADAQIEAAQQGEELTIGRRATSTVVVGAGGCRPGGPSAPTVAAAANKIDAQLRAMIQPPAGGDHSDLRREES